MLLLHDIGGSLCYRANEKPVGPNGETNPDYRIQNGRVVYVRPGALDYIKKIKVHPRVIFGFYSSMKTTNAQDVVKMIAQDDSIGPFEIFDAQHCTEMSRNSRYKPIQKNHWDTLRDLGKVVNSDFCRDN